MLLFVVLWLFKNNFDQIISEKVKDSYIFATLVNT